MTKAEIRKHCDYWMLNSLKDAIDSTEKGYRRSTINEAMAQARQVLLMASSMGVISHKDFEAINNCICFSSLNA